MNKTRQAILVALATSFTLSSIAEEQSPVIVTATRTAQTTDETLASVTVITRQDLESSQAQTIVEVLQAVNGINTGRTGGIGKSASVYLRGTESDHTLVIIDGVRASSATLGSYAWNSLSPEQIERIEIVRGPRASLYGSDAIGGVIQIFTRKNKHAQVQLGYGSKDTSKVSVSLAGGDKWKYSFNTGRLNTSGIPVTPSSNEDRGYENLHAAFNLNGNINPGTTLTLTANQAEGTNELDPGTGNEEYLNRIINLQLQHNATSTWSHTLSLGNALDEYVTFSPYNPAIITTRRQDFSWQNDFIVDSNNLFTLGIDYRADHAENNSNTIDNTVYNHAAFAEYQLNLDSFDLNIGGRNDENSVYGSHSTGNIAIGFNISEAIRFTASHGTSFKAPSFNDIYWPFRSDPCWFNAAQTCITQGNLNLKPEEASSSEIGLSYKQPDLEIALNIYTTDTENLIEWATTQTGANEFTTTPSNVSKTSIEGAELQIDIPLGKWTTSTRFNYVKAINDVTKVQLDRRSKRNLAFIAQRTINNHSLYSEIIARSRFKDSNGSLTKSGYALVNLNYGYQLDKESKINLRIDNALNKKYVNASSSFSGDYNAPGRAFFISYTEKF